MHENEIKRDPLPAPRRFEGKILTPPKRVLKELRAMNFKRLYVGDRVEFRPVTDLDGRRRASAVDKIEEPEEEEEEDLDGYDFKSWMPGFQTEEAKEEKPEVVEVEHEKRKVMGLEDEKRELARTIREGGSIRVQWNEPDNMSPEEVMATLQMPGHNRELLKPDPERARALAKVFRRKPTAESPARGNLSQAESAYLDASLDASELKAAGGLVGSFQLDDEDEEMEYLDSFGVYDTAETAVVFTTKTAGPNMGDVQPEDGRLRASDRSTEDDDVAWEDEDDGDVLFRSTTSARTNRVAPPTQSPVTSALPGYNSARANRVPSSTKGHPCQPDRSHCPSPIFLPLVPLQPPSHTTPVNLWHSPAK